MTSKPLFDGEKRYNVVYADPPWKYSSDPKAKRGIWGLAKDHYESMSIQELKELPVASIAADDCICFLWATFPLLAKSIEVLEAWGFEYKTVAFVWVKQNKKGTGIKKYGLGWYTRSNCEIVLIGRKGKFNRHSKKVQQVVLAPLQEHSRKPEEVARRIEELCGPVPKIELFARTKRKGWDVWGDQTELFEEETTTQLQLKQEMIQ